jgi:triacylglycerol esterase/lipase EstA (alpha/beta hydrolase family)
LTYSSSTRTLFSEEFNTIPNPTYPIFLSFSVALLILQGCSMNGGDSQLIIPDESGPEISPENSPELPPSTSPCTLTVGPEGDFIPQDTITSATREHCQSAVHASAGAEGSTLRVSLDSWQGEGSATLRVTDLLGHSIAELEGGAEGSSILFQLDQSGEFLLYIEPTDPEASPNDYSLSTTCVAECREFTRYPIVFFHGMAGTDNFLGIMDYWYGVTPILSEAGYLTEMPPGGALAEPAQRAAQFSEALDGMEEEGLGRRFNLVAHSQGGVDARYLISALNQGERIASLTTIASPHHGSPFADIVGGTVFAIPGFNQLVDEALTEFTELLGLGPGELAEATKSVTVEAMEEFNATMLDSEHTAYFSWSGRTCGYAELLCQYDNNGEIVSPMFWASYRLIAAIAGPNDGLVPIDSAQWGEHLGTLPADHLDEVGLLFGQSGTFDHEAFYLSEARRLAEQGF